MQEGISDLRARAADRARFYDIGCKRASGSRPIKTTIKWPVYSRALSCSALKDWFDVSYPGEN